VQICFFFPKLGPMSHNGVVKLLESNVRRWLIILQVASYMLLPHHLHNQSSDSLV
jgi:hypothetical protein